jgi:hypothetical protein
VIKKETVMISRYKDGITKIRGMCNVTAKVMPVIIRVHTKNVTIPEQHAGKARNYGVTKHNQLDTALILGRVLQ